MDRIIAQRGDLCLLTVEGYIQVMEAPRFLPVALAGWAPENEFVVGYLEGDTIYRLVDEETWLKVLRDYRQRMLDNVLEGLKQRGLLNDPPTISDDNEA